MRLRHVISILSLLICGCGASGTDDSSPPSDDPSAPFLPVNAFTSGDSPDPASTGLFVFSSHSPTEPPKRITTQPVLVLGAHVSQSLDAQGKMHAGNPDLLFFTSEEPGGDHHVWSLNVTGNSNLVPRQLSSLTLPYYQEHFGPGVNGPLVACGSQAIAKDLSDPTSVLLFISVPTSQFPYCTTNPATTQWYLLRWSDGPGTPPVSLPLLTSAILPLYRPDGILAGLVAVDSAHNLSLYPDETMTNARVLLTDVVSVRSRQERGPRLEVSDPTYSFLQVMQAPGALYGSVYRIDYTGHISGSLHDFAGSVDEAVVESNTLFVTEANSYPGYSTELVARVPGDGSAAQVLSNFYKSDLQGGGLPVLAGISGPTLVLSAVTPQQQDLVQTLRKDGPGDPVTIGTYDDGIDVRVVDGDILVSVFSNTTNPEGVTQYQSSTQVMDSTGAVLQPLTPSSEFLSGSTPLLQVRGIADTGGGVGGGKLYTLDLSQPSAPLSPAFELIGGAPFSFPSNSQYVGLTYNQIDSSHAFVQYGDRGLVLDLARRIVVPVSIPNASLSFLLTPDRLAN